jgi:D-tyrosyl-tRNA(Tyr) deacylase
MIAVLQRVSRAQVTVEAAEGGSEVSGAIGLGLLVLLGVGHDDGDEEAALLGEKSALLRIFEDDEGKMNRSVIDVGGSALVVSQFTLLADCRKGRRPSFIEAAEPLRAERLYEVFCRDLEGHGVPVERGRFGAHMEVSLVNDGPVTILLDTTALRRPRREP